MKKNRATNRANGGSENFMLELGRGGGKQGEGLIQESRKRRNVVSTRLTRTLNIPRRKLHIITQCGRGAPNTIQKNKDSILFEFFFPPRTTGGGVHAKPKNNGDHAAPSTQTPTRNQPMNSITLSNNTLGFTSVLLSIVSV
jgi:hypothetical protein